eukprot:TRINITY_DN25019_c0_g3_i1.p1 TRINITY_DN25019_c0_g3~~TRINITY_DN25019_c0_g3_i1.p1  ORF type:complete len:1184 (+),score=393.12 TRINITY_DN25019_c0_g3_i1:31-3582(+)
MVMARSQSEDLLRKAYNDRVRCLGRKLQSGDAGSDASPSRPRARRHSRSGNVSTAVSCLRSQDAADLELEIEGLVRRVRCLCQERRTVRRELEETERRSAAVVQDLRGKLTDAQAEHAKLARQRSELHDALAALADESHRVSNAGGAKNEKIRRAETEVDRLTSASRLLAGHLSALQVEAAEYRRRTDAISQESSLAQRSAVDTGASQAAARGELEDLLAKARQSELERQELEEKFTVVGRRFQQVADASEREGREAARLLKTQCQSLRRKAEKQRRRNDDLKMQLQDAEQLAARQASTIAEKDGEIAKLREACRLQRDAALRHEEEFCESQRRALQAQASELERLGGMMPIAGHQRVFKEQGEYYRACLRELEEALRQRIQAQEEALRRQGEAMRRQELAMRQQQDDALRQHRHVQERQQQKLWEQWHLLQQEEEERERLLEQLVLEGGPVARCRELEAAVRDAEGELARLESTAAGVDEHRRSLAASLETAGGRLGGLRATFDAATRGRRSAEASLAKQRAALESERRALAAATAAISEVEDASPTAATVPERLQAALDEHEQRSADLSRTSAQLREALRGRSVECARLRGETREAEAKLSNLQQLASELERQRNAGAAVVQRKEDALRRMVYLLRGHAEQQRRSAGELRAKAKEECRVFSVELNGWEDRWRALSGKASEHSSAHQRSGRSAAEAAVRDAEEHARHLDSLVERGSRMRDAAETAARGGAAAAAACDRLRAALRRSSVAAEQVVRSICAGLPDGLPEATTRMLLAAAAGGDSAEGASSGGETAEAVQAERALADVEADVRRGIAATRSAATEAERQRWAALTAREKARREEADEKVRASIEERRAAVEAEAARLEGELKALPLPEAGGSGSGGGSSARSTEEGAGEEDVARAAALRQEIAEVEASAREAANRAEEARSELEAGALEASMAVEEAERRTKAPLEAEVRDVTGQLERLRSGLQSELGRYAADWKAHLEQLTRAHRAEEQRANGLVIEQASQHDREVAKAALARGEALRTQEAQAERIRMDLAATTQRMDESEGELRQLRIVREARRRGTRHLQEALSRLERRIGDANDASARERREAEEDERHLTKLHSEAVARLKRQKGDEVARLEAFMSQSLSTLSAELSMDSDAALQAHGELRASAERLAGRARSRLDAAAAGDRSVASVA